MTDRLLEHFRVDDTAALLVLAFGVVAHLVFASRFVVQWIVSERRRQSVVPLAFWYLSMAGAAMIFVYGLLRGEPLMIAGPIPGCVVYVRNIMLIRRARRFHGSGAARTADAGLAR